MRVICQRFGSHYGVSTAASSATLLGFLCAMVCGLTACNPSPTQTKSPSATKPMATPPVDSSQPSPPPFVEVTPSQQDADEESIDALYARAVRAARAGAHAESIALLDEIIEREPRAATAFYTRGRAHFRLGNMEQSLKDFDQMIKLLPDAAPRLWERGITLYYLKQYQEGADQFKLYQTYYNKDVENAVWQFICRAKVDGMDTARENMLHIEGDTRVPLMEIYGLFRGELQPADVIEAAQQPSQDPDQTAMQQFYADLYLGFYYEAVGNIDEAKKHIQQAMALTVDAQPPTNNYMWDVARMHARWLDETEHQEN